MTTERTSPVAPPEIRDRGAFRVVGFAATCPTQDISAIPGLWQALSAWQDAVEAPGAAYGVSFDMSEAGDFRYIAGREATVVPEGMEAVDIPAGRYAVFTHDGQIADLPRMIRAIWTTALPEAGLTPAAAPEFELYDSRFDPVTGTGVVEIWIPLG